MAGTITLLSADGQVDAFRAEQAPPLSYLQHHVGGYIEVIRVHCHGRLCHLVVNEEGRLHGLPFNERATRILRTNPNLTHDIVVGNAVLLDGVLLD